MKADKSRHGSSTAFLDLLFNVLLGFVLLLIILIAIIKVESAKPAVEDKNEFVITVNWDDGVDNDVDIWVMSPNEEVINFRNKEAGGMFLQRDDTGNRGVDVLSHTPLGNPDEYVPLNQEIVNIRKIVPGTYVVNLHFFAKRYPDPANVVVKLYKINPYSEVATITEQLLENNEEKTVLIFTVDAHGSVFVEPLVETSIISKEVSK